MMIDSIARTPPHKCLFCNLEEVPFERVEHPIPESLGNDDLIIPKGFVCDPCNQYFGTKLEKDILASPPFNIERTAAAIKTKKGKYSKHIETNYEVSSTGYWDRVIFLGNIEMIGRSNDNTSSLLFINPPPNYAKLLVRFMLKMAIELLLFTDVEDPYSSKYDNARLCARTGEYSDKWQVAYGIYPRREDLVISKRVDEIGPLETRQLYEYSIGVMENDDLMFSFIYINHCFACNLTNFSIKEYVDGFNRINDFRMQIYKG